MENWKSEIDLVAVHTAYGNQILTVSQVAIKTIELIKQNRYADHPKIQFIIDDLNLITDDMNDEEAQELYDDCLARLYDFGDEGLRIWVKTFERNFT